MRTIACVADSSMEYDIVTLLGNLAGCANFRKVESTPTSGLGGTETEALPDSRGYGERLRSG
jgi:hypothetical protein